MPGICYHQQAVTIWHNIGLRYLYVVMRSINIDVSAVWRSSGGLQGLNRLDITCRICPAQAGACRRCLPVFKSLCFARRLHISDDIGTYLMSCHRLKSKNDSACSAATEPGCRSAQLNRPTVGDFSSTAYYTTAYAVLWFICGWVFTLCFVCLRCY